MYLALGRQGQEEPHRVPGGRGPQCQVTALISRSTCSSWQELGGPRSTRGTRLGAPDCQQPSPGGRGVPSAGHIVVPQEEPHQATWRPRQRASAHLGGTAGPGPDAHGVRGPGSNATPPALLGDWDEPTPASAPRLKVGGWGEEEHQGPDAWEGPSGSPPESRRAGRPVSTRQSRLPAHGPLPLPGPGPEHLPVVVFFIVGTWVGEKTT